MNTGRMFYNDASGNFPLLIIKIILSNVDNQQPTIAIPCRPVKCLKCLSLGLTQHPLIHGDAFMKAKTIMFVMGSALVLLCAGLLIAGTAYYKANVNPVHYDLQENDEISWGIFDTYSKDGVPMTEYKAVLNAKIADVGDTLIDTDAEQDLTILTEVIMGTFLGMDLKIPVYFDIYTFTTILLDVVTSDISLPELSAIHVVTSESARAFQTVLENLSHSVLPSEENATTLARYMSFFTIGILPTSFNYTILTDFCVWVNDFTDWLLGFPVFEIEDSSSSLTIRVNSTSYGNLSSLIQDAGVQFYDNETVGTFTMTWDKDAGLLKESIVKVTYVSSNVVREFGLRLVRTTMTDSYPDTLSETDFSLDLASSGELIALKVSNIVMLGLSATTLIGMILLYRKRV